MPELSLDKAFLACYLTGKDTDLQNESWDNNLLLILEDTVKLLGIVSLA